MEEEASMSEGGMSRTEHDGAGSGALQLGAGRLIQLKSCDKVAEWTARVVRQGRAAARAPMSTGGGAVRP
jgi:hypothetical protein